MLHLGEESKIYPSGIYDQRRENEEEEQADVEVKTDIPIYI